MSLYHTYITNQTNIINTSTYGSTMRAAIANSIKFLDDILVKIGASNSFVVCTQDEYDNLPAEDKTAAAYFIVPEDS